MGLSFPTYPLSKKYTQDTAEEFGAVKGAPCTVESQAHDATNHVTNVVLKWENSEGAVQRTTVPVPDGVGIVSITKASTSGKTDTYTISFTNNTTTTFTVTNGSDGEDGVGIVSITKPDPEVPAIVVNYTNGTSSDPITIPTVQGEQGEPGEDGVSPSVTVKTSTSSTYVLEITDASGSFDTPNLKGSSDTVTKKAITASVEVGGISKDTSFPVGTDYDDLWSALLEKTIYPTLSAPSASLSYSADAYVAVGGTISAKTATLTYNAGAITLDGVKQNDRGGAATGFTIATTGADTEYSDSSEISGSFSVPALTRATKGTIKLTGTVSYAQGAQPKDSKGNDYDAPLPAGSVTSEKTITFIQPFYYGVSNSSTVADFTGLTANVTPKGNKTFSYTTSNQYMVIAYDSSYGNLKNIIDPNGFETISGWTKNSLTVGGFSYFVYVADSATTDTNAAFTFKF